jgi:hypothetical protein
MIDKVVSLARLSVPVPYVWVMGTVLVGVVGWCVQLQGEVTSLIQNGSPASTSALQQLASLAIRVDELQKLSPQIPINGNRITRLETQLEIIQKELYSKEILR